MTRPSPSQHMLAGIRTGADGPAWLTPCPELTSVATGLGDAAGQSCGPSSTSAQGTGPHDGQAQQKHMEIGHPWKGWRWWPELEGMVWGSAL